MLSSKQIAEDICKLQRKVGLVNAKVPVLVGKTSSGKTYWIQNVLSNALRLPVVKVLLQNEQPDEVMGYPRYVEGDGLTYLKPAWWTDQPSIFFFDEIDKARDDLHASILTLLREGTVRGESLPTGSVIICAMNEDDNLSEPLKARSVFLPFQYEPRDTTLDNVAQYLQESWTLYPEMPDQIQNMESVHFLELYQQINPVLTQQPEVLRQLLMGIFPKKQVPSIYDMLCGVEEVNYQQVLDNEEYFNNFMATQRSVEQIARHYVEFIKVGKSAKHAQRLTALLSKFASTNADDLVALYKNTHDILIDQYPNLSRHEFSPEFVRQLGKSLAGVLSGFTNEVDTLYYSWDVDR
tara:strand:+ start:629 stop:1681 length:1053 start_codon:yes stop_codon:yes gene_type:complete